MLITIDALLTIQQRETNIYLKKRHRSDDRSQWINPTVHSRTLRAASSFEGTMACIRKRVARSLRKRDSLKTTAGHYGTVPLRAPKRFHVRGMERSQRSALSPTAAEIIKIRGDRGSGSIRRGRGNVEQREFGARLFHAYTTREINPCC